MYYLNVSGITVCKGKILEIIQALGLLNNLVIAPNSLQYCSGETYIQNFFKKEWITTIYKYYYKIYSGSMSSEKPAFSNSNLNKILL